MIAPKKLKQCLVATRYMAHTRALGEAARALA
jgi:hypothetical protein